MLGSLEGIGSDGTGVPVTHTIAARSVTTDRAASRHDGVGPHTMCAVPSAVRR